MVAQHHTPHNHTLQKILIPHFVMNPFLLLMMLPMHLTMWWSSVASLSIFPPRACRPLLVCAPLGLAQQITLLFNLNLNLNINISINLNLNLCLHHILTRMETKKKKMWQTAEKQIYHQEQHLPQLMEQLKKRIAMTAFLSLATFFGGVCTKTHSRTLVILPQQWLAFHQMMTTVHWGKWINTPNHRETMQITIMKKKMHPSTDPKGPGFLQGQHRLPSF